MTPLVTQLNWITHLLIMFGSKSDEECELRTPIIAKMLFLSKTTEQFGSGFKRIHSLCEDAGIRYFYERTNKGFMFVIYRSNFISDKMNVNYDENLNKTERAVLAIFRQNTEISRGETVLVKLILLMCKSERRILK